MAITLATTTTTADIAANDTRIYLASVSGITSTTVRAGLCLFINAELMLIISAPIGLSVGVTRGFGGSGSTTHASGSTAYIGTPIQFYTVDPIGVPPTSPAVTPWINTANGNIWTVSGNAWTLPSATITVADTRVVFADGANSPAGDAGMTYNKTTDILTLLGAVLAPYFTDGTNYSVRYGSAKVQFRDAADTADADVAVKKLYASDTVILGNGGNGFEFTTGTVRVGSLDGSGSANLISFTSANTGAATQFQLDLPVITSGFGTSPSIAGSSSAFRVTVGSSPGTSGVVTFAKAWTNAPICIVINETTSNVVRVTASTTTATFNGVVVANDKLSFLCFGYL